MSSFWQGLSKEEQSITMIVRGVAALGVFANAIHGQRGMQKMWDVLLCENQVKSPMQKCSEFANNIRAISILTNEIFDKDKITLGLVDSKQVNKYKYDPFIDILT